MKIIRQRRPERFTVIDDALIENLACLSFRACGLLVYLLSRPDGWTTSAERLSRLGKEGRDAIRTTLKELQACGYLDVVQSRDSRTGRWRTDYVVRDLPERAAENPPSAENPSRLRPAEMPRAQTGNRRKSESERQ